MTKLLQLSYDYDLNSLAQELATLSAINCALLEEVKES